MLDDCIQAAHHVGLRRLRPLASGQNLVLSGIWHGRRVVAKARLQTHRRRLLKEQRWLERTAQIGIACPDVVTVLEDVDWIFLLLREHLPRRVRPWLPADWHAASVALQRLQVDAPGWGPLRADDQPRWQQEGHALAWYREQAARCGRPELEDELHVTWRRRERGLIHGDLHPGNRIGDLLCDWEQVAVADPLEDACRLALATGYNPRACIQAWGGEPGSDRARGALLRSVVEGATHRGPRHEQARRLLQLL
ncbi:MAG: phosphotransferase family protein [Planctomycetota bacterium]